MVAMGERAAEQERRSLALYRRAGHPDRQLTPAEWCAYCERHGLDGPGADLEGERNAAGGRGVGGRE